MSVGFGTVAEHWAVVGSLTSTGDAVVGEYNVKNGVFTKVTGAMPSSTQRAQKGS